MGVRVLENQKEFELVLKEAGCKLVVVDFSAVWCHPCNNMKPTFLTLAEKHQDVIFCEVDVDDAQDCAESCGIKCMPTFQFYKNGQMVFEFSGANKTTLEDKIQELC
ncbi:thioredoxin-like [Stegostoma tigrinum]|uniref:thioredoxin-like n=1 Tax=Stegostoma tigrinum TaxID=3053191 RepID=UPI00286FD8B1|nr:thioredoxin-like [Stegostoma tigrinum]